MSCPTLCNPMDCSTPGSPVLHHLPEFAQTHVHWVGDAIQPSHPLLPLSPPALNLSQHRGLFQSQLFTSGGQNIGASWTDDSVEFWQNAVPWRREWQSTPGFLLQEPHEHKQYEKSTMLQFKNKEHLQGKPVLASQGTREEGYADPATATQDAMVTRASAQGSCGAFVGQPGAAVLLGGLWHFRCCGRHASRGRGSTRRFCKWCCVTRAASSWAWVMSSFFIAPLWPCSKKQAGDWGEGGVTNRGKPGLSRHLF